MNIGNNSLHLMHSMQPKNEAQVQHSYDSETTAICENEKPYNTNPFGRSPPGHSGFLTSNANMSSSWEDSTLPFHGRFIRCGETRIHSPVSGLYRLCWCSVHQPQLQQLRSATSYGAESSSGNRLIYSLFVYKYKFQSRQIIHKSGLLLQWWHYTTKNKLTKIGGQGHR